MSFKSRLKRIEKRLNIKRDDEIEELVLRRVDYQINKQGIERNFCQDLEEQHQTSD